LLQAFTGIHNDLACEMEAECGLPIEHYEILLMLYEGDAEGMRPSEIAQRRLLSRSGATRLVDRLEQDNLVERKTFGTDRRGSLVTLTANGKKTFVRAGRVHLAGIQKHVGQRLTAAETSELRRILSKLHDN